MNQPEDDYAALHSYIQLVELEIDQVINGVMSCEGSGQTEPRPSLNKTLCRPPTLALPKNTERIFEGKASKPPKGCKREKRINYTKSNDFDTGIIELPVRKGNRRKVLDLYNGERQGFVRSGDVASSQGKKQMNSSLLGVGEAEDLFVVEDTGNKDELLQNILDTQEKSELPDASSQEGGDLLCDARINAAPTARRIKKRPTDLQKLLDTDRDSLILGPGVRVREKDCDHCPERMSRCSLTIHHCHHHEHRHKHRHRHHRCTSEPGGCPDLQLDHMVGWLQSCQPCQYHQQHRHRRHHHQRGFCYCSVSDNDLFVGLPPRKYSDPLVRVRPRKNSDLSDGLHTRKLYGSLNSDCCLAESCDPLDKHRTRQCNDPLDELHTTKSVHALNELHRRKSSDPLDDYNTRTCSHPLEKMSSVGSSDPFENHSTEKNVKLLSKIDKDAQRINKTSSARQSPHTERIEPVYPLSIPNPSPALSTDAIRSEATTPQSDLEILEDDKDQDVSTSDRSYTDSELRDIFDSPESNLTSSVNRHKLSRSSYPNNTLIISPPPGFASPDSEDEMWVKVRLVTRSHDDLRCRSDKHSAAALDNASDVSEFQYYPTPFDFDGTRQLSQRSPISLDDLFIPRDFSLEKEQHCTYDKGNSSSNKHTTTLEHSSSSPAQFGTRIIPTETPRRGKPPMKEYSGAKGHCKVRQEAEELNFQNSKSCVAPDAEVISSDLSVDESTFSSPTDILRPPSWEYSKSGFSSYSDSSVISAEQSSKGSNQSKGHGHSTGRHQSLQTSFPVIDQTESRPYPTGTGVVITPDSLDSSLSSELLPTLEEDKNNNTSRNILSMCLASDCKLLKSCRLQRSTQSHVKLHSGSQTTEKHHEYAVNMLAPEKSTCSQYPSSSIIQISDDPGASSQRKDEATDAQFQLQATRTSGANSSEAGSSEATESTVEKCNKGTWAKETPCLEEKHIKDQCSISIFNSVDNSDNCVMKKVALKDTAVQTSLEMEGFVADITDNLTGHNRVTGQTVKDIGQDIDRAKCWNDIICDSSHCSVRSIESNKTCDKEDKEGMLHCSIEPIESNIAVPGDFNAKLCSAASEVTRTAEEKTPFRTSLLRSKSVHESQNDGNERRNRRVFRPDASCLSGNLRELSHLNIDVSQRLIGGEQRFVVSNGSPELQVVVNSLTPVLTRRSRARNTRRVHNLDSVTEVPGSLKTSTDNEPASAAIEPNDGSVASNLSLRSSSFEKNPNSLDSNDMAKALPVYTGLRNYEVSNKNNVEKNISTMQEDLIGKHLTGLKERGHNRIFRSASARTSSAARNMNTSAKDAEDSVNEELFEEFDQAEKQLFLSPKLSHTWHGSSTRSTHRSAPRMGLGRKLDGGVKYARRADGSIGPIVLSPSPQPTTSQAHQHANTMPVISRTLLDALHKRYCAYQYSNHYQTIQQFSLLKLDSTITTGNQAVTALLAEPLHARGHEVQAAPPSPEIMARLRMLKKTIDSNTEKSGIQQVLHSTAREQPSISPCQPHVFQESLLEQDPMEFTTSAEEAQPLNSWYMRHDSSLELQDKLNHGGKLHAELEAAEALKWLRAAGFPQYAQMFDDGQFPVDMGIVERDHDFLDKDSLQSLFRRLETLNRYAGIKRDSHPCKKSTSEEEDEDDFCALSERWEYQKSARRWSRKDLAPSCQLTTVALKDDLAARSGSHDSLLADQDSGSQVGDSPLLKSKISHKSVIQSPGTNDMVSVSHQALAAAEITPGNTDLVDSPMSPPLRRATSEKTKTAKNLFKKMEGMKSGKSRRQSSHRNIVEISGPVVADKQNMQAKLEKLNCVDIPQGANTQLRPRVNVSESSDRGLSSSTESHHLPSGTCGAQPSPPSPHPPSSPRPHSDFLLRSKEGRPHVPPQTGNHTRPSSTSTNQRPSLAHDSSFEEYYQAQTAFLQNLQSSPRSTAESVRKNNSETNLMEIFLVPQDHQPGRFPRVLQNGYIETEACGTAVNVRTGSVRLGRNSCMKSDHGTASLRSPQLSEAESLANRLSVYDNCSSPSGEERQGKRSEESQSSSAIPSATEVRSSGESKQTTDSLIRESTEVDKHGFIQEVNSDSSREDSRDTSRESSVVRTTWNFSHQPLRNPDHERSVSFESSTSSQSPDDSTLVNVEDLASTDSKSSKLSSSDSLSSKSKVTHSSSVDSYFRGISSQSGRPVSDSSTTMPANTFQENYDEFDRILQELYKNINDLTTFMDKDKNEKTPRLVRAATSPLPAGSPHPHSPLHVATAPVRPILRPQQNVPEPKSPSSATSDLVHSPASPGSPQDSNEPLDFYGALELDHENSSSGGEGSNTAESGSEDQALTDISQDDSLDQIIEVSRERRDSGVGHSLTRAPSDRRRKKIRWHSFQKSHRPDISSRAMQINSLTVSQLVRLQKLSLLRLTGIMEKCLPVNKSGWNWMVPRFMKRHKAPDFSDKNVFGVPLSVMAQRTGQPLPQCVLYAMRYLRRTCPSAVGIFRKSGVKSKIQQLRDYLEAHPDTTNFDGENAYNVADMLKTFFRDLPECLLTNKMSETFRSIYTYVPQPQRLDAIQAAILLLPDENREVLQSILLFLSDISEHEADHQMNASNLAVCFTPTVFHLGPRQSVPYSPKRNRKNSSGVPDPREIMEQKAAHECLLMMITDCKKLFTVPSNLFRQLQVQSVAHLEASLPQDIGSCPADVRAFGQEKIQMVLKESHDKNRGWLPTMTIGDVEVFHRKPMDDCLLKEWKLIVDIEAPPVEVLRRIMHERHTWDEDLLSWSVVERLDQHSDIFQFVLNSMAPHPPRNFCVLRYWRSDLNKGACALITMSVEHSDTLEIQGVWAVDLGTYYLMEPCGSGRSRLTYITRVDTRGRMPEWYTKIFGHICANFLDRLKESFKQDASGPETKV